MFKVLIIDDEPIIRKGLKNIVNWKQLGCEICGEASDGLEGIEEVKKCLPDIIITDIRMPEVDGLTMIREIKDTVSHCKIIILTGYRDFDYVHEAIKLGAFDFILKPTKIGELTAIINRAVKELKFHKERMEEFDKLRSLFEQNIPILREKLLYDALWGINTNESEMKERMELFKVSISDFILLVIENDFDAMEADRISPYDRHLYQFGIINTFAETFADRFNVINIPLNDARIAFIVQEMNNGANCLNTLTEKCMQMQEIVSNCFGFTVTIAISSEGRGAPDLPIKLRECQQSLEYKLYIGTNSIIPYSDLNSFFTCEDYSLLEKYQHSLLESIKAGNEKIVRGKLQDIFSYIQQLSPVNLDYVRNFYWTAISSINNIRVSVSAADSEAGQAKNSDISSLHELIRKCSNIKELQDVLEEAALRVASRVNHYNSKSLKLILRKALEHIQLHYNEPITLQDVANHAYVSTCYISRMFTKELGKNFVEYLNEVRIEKAKELLRDVRYKTYEVAEMVGIPDAHYFSRLFKKHTGATPTEFRESATGK